MSYLHQIAVGKDRARGSVVFVHGLWGDPFGTWGGETEDAPGFWPRWLAEDLPGFAVYSIGYEAEPSEYTGFAMSLKDRSQNILALLRNERALREGPIAFVFHSLGGLVVKQLLRSANEQKEDDPAAAQLLDRVAQVVFVATPHIGARLPIILERLAWLTRPNVVIKDLEYGDPQLNELFRWYTDHCGARTIEHLVFRETQPTRFSQLVVDEASSNPGVSGALFIPIDANHIDICKPENREADVYRITREFLKGLPAAKPHSARSAAGVPQGSVVHRGIRAVPNFNGREEELASITAALWSSEDGRVTSTNSNASAAVLFGLAGVGKSVLAQEYAWRNRERYAGVWWLRAEETETLIDDLLELGNWFVQRLPEDRTEALHLVLHHLSKTAPNPWLLVYDNVEQPEAIAALMPAEGAHILITTRWPNWQGYASEIRVGVPSPSLAIEFLRGRVQLGDHESAGRLAEPLGYLPLALAHARAYCWTTGSSFDEYRAKFPELIRKLPRGAPYPENVFATFELALAKAAKQCAAAEELMGLLAFFAPDSIPLILLSESTMTEIERRDAIAALREMSLLELHSSPEGPPTISVHRLVQEVMRGRLSEASDQARIAAAEATRLVAEEYEKDRKPFAGLPRNMILLPHAKAVLEHAPKEGPGALDTLRLLMEIGDTHGHHGNSSAAYTAYRDGQVLAKYLFRAKADLSTTDQLSVVCLSWVLYFNIGHTLCKLGKDEDALVAYRAALAMVESFVEAMRVSGPCEPSRSVRARGLKLHRGRPRRHLRRSRSVRARGLKRSCA